MRAAGGPGRARFALPGWSTWLDRPGFLATLLLVPTLVLVFGVLLYPILDTLRMSLTDRVLSQPDSGTFIGLANYLRALQDPEFRASLGRTFYFALITVPAETTLGLLIALLQQVGLIDHYHIWLGYPVSAFHLVIVANIWKETPVAVILLLAALQTIPLEQYEAARVDGANAWRQFWAVTFPSLRAVIAVTMVVKTVWALKEFDLIYVMTGGGPANATNVATFYTYLTTFKFLKFGYGAAMAFILVVLSLIIAFFYVRMISPREAAE